MFIVFLIIAIVFFVLWRIEASKHSKDNFAHEQARSESEAKYNLYQNISISLTSKKNAPGSKKRQKISSPLHR